MKLIYQILITLCLIAGIILFYTSAKQEDEFLVNLDAYNKKDFSAEDIKYSDLIKQNDQIPNKFHNGIFSFQKILEASGNIDNITFKIAIPKTEIGSQYISNLNINPKPQRIYNTDTNLIAEYKITNLKKGTYAITVSGNAYVDTYNIEKAKRINKNTKPEKKLYRYLTEEKGIEINNRLIKNIASKINGNSREEIVGNIYRYVKNNVKYDYMANNPSAVKTLKSKRGKCGGFSSAMVALCRAKGIPARIVSGHIIREKDNNHTWVEVYYDEYGWVTYDPTTTIKEITYVKKGNVINKEERVIENLKYISSIKNDFGLFYLTYSNVNTSSNGTLAIREEAKIREIK